MKCNLLPDIRIRLIEGKTKKLQNLKINENENSFSEIKYGAEENFKQLCVKVGKSKKTMSLKHIF